MLSIKKSMPMSQSKTIGKKKGKQCPLSPFQKKLNPKQNIKI